MEKKIFDALQKQANTFFKQFNLDYSFEKNKTEENTKIVGSHYRAYEQYWYNNGLNQKFEVSITFYLDSDSKSLIDVQTFRQNKTDQRWMNVGDYFKKQKNMPFLRLEDYDGDSIEENIESFFKWFEENSDEKLIRVLQGKEWIETPFDWGKYK